MSTKVLFITPPFTQLNTPYPATAYLKGYLNTLGVSSHQADLGLEVMLRLFSREGLSQAFELAEEQGLDYSDNVQRMIRMKPAYLQTIETVIDFLQDKNPTLAYHIAEGNFLPQAERFSQLDDVDWAFGSMGLRDKARYLSTLYLEDLGDLITEAIDPHFGFSRYAEQLGMSASTFDGMEAALQEPVSLIDALLLEVLEEKIRAFDPASVALSIPFPGNLYGGLRCGQYLKARYPGLKVWMGGGYPNTELRTLKDPRIFDYVDFITLDDGEAPVRLLLEHLDGHRTLKELKRTFVRVDGEVRQFNNPSVKDVAQRDVGTPDYADLPLGDYLSVIEVANPMHRLWSDGRWNKLTLAHGCYWGKCTFCDISLDYIGRYEPITAAMLCDRIEEIMAKTGTNGFHFVDEAAPPALMRDLALEILRRGLIVVWWTNIRFESNFTADLCRLLRASGCIAISGGLEVASDRLLGLIKKGVTVAQVARVTHHLTQSGIMVHAYLMYGYPTQTAQETVDSLEMVRQLFEEGVLQSGFWHRFAMTAHSPVGLNPAAFGVQRTDLSLAPFANNEVEYEDPLGVDHAAFSEGLRKSLFNYMHGIGFDMPLDKWFDFEIPATTIPENYIRQQLLEEPPLAYKKHQRIVWIGAQPDLQDAEEEGFVELVFSGKKEDFAMELPLEFGEWVAGLLTQVSYDQPLNRLQVIWEDYEATMGDFEDLVESEVWEILREQGLLIF
ncbi:B12-binding domain-containing radical SAM protein [Echinicola vietnamensis]|uniref:Fe-S oxidoreductase n=1 Tax=Echinicola vietnamensis (strain DSM 17526 / LMG 23754 / KMM 6221) TaxID=926556 RepID=L0G5E4_ECHVK|nr:radical SAM protein [Echinicola vietnamensis]AGA80050.1 Fe-S oxidoreductase [Echinicola vietnamensis DSM 17526]